MGEPPKGGFSFACCRPKISDMAANNDRERFAKGEDAHESVGVPHGGEVLLGDEPTGEVVVYEFDDDGNFVGWHKEAQ